MDPPPTIFARSALGVTGLASPPRAFLGASAISFLLAGGRIQSPAGWPPAAPGSGGWTQNGGEGRGVAMARGKDVHADNRSYRPLMLSASVVTRCGSRSCEE